MTPGPISEVPGFRRPEPQEERPPATRDAPLIDAVPGITHGNSTDAPVAATPTADSVTFPTQPVSPPPVAPARDAEFATPPPPPPPPPPPLPPSQPLAPPVVMETAVTDAPVTEDAAMEPAVPSPLDIDLWGEFPGPVEGEDIDATRAAHRFAVLVLRWDDGTVLRPTSPTVVGRDPVAAGAEVAVALDDPSRSLSKTHARFTPGLVPTVEDLHSTNGVRIDRDGAAIAVPPGEQV
jgi:hypothetical protein